MLKFLLDTNACIVYIKHSDSNVRRKIQGTQTDCIAVCSVVKYEMFYGSLRSQSPESSLQKQLLFLSQFRSLPFDDDASRFAAEIRADLSSSGRMIGAYDIQIAAIALANDLTLVTHNTSEFSRVSGLNIEDWEA